MIFLDQQNRFDKPREARGERSESFEVTLRRFFRDVQQSGILTEIKKRRFRDKNVSREKRRVAARRKVQIRRIKRGY